MKGRKPATGNVVPLTGGSRRDFDASAKELARELKPRGMSAEASKIWDRIAPTLTHPLCNRLRAQHAETFRLYCESHARHEALRAYLRENGETYQAMTRNGLQLKSRPEVAQLNETWRQVVRLSCEFGMTPAAERAVLNGDQPMLPFDDRDDFA